MAPGGEDVRCAMLSAEGPRAPHAAEAEMVGSDSKRFHFAALPPRLRAGVVEFRTLGFLYLISTSWLRRPNAVRAPKAARD